MMFTKRNGIGAQVKNAVTNKNGFLPHTSDRAPIKGADRKLKNPFIPNITPFMIRA